NALRQGTLAIDGDGDPQWVREALPASLKTVETFLYSSPENGILLETLAQGYGQYAFGFLEDDLERMGEGGDDETKRRSVGRATEFYDRSAAFGTRLAAIEEPKIAETVKGDIAGLEKLLKEGDFDDEKDARG